MSILHDSWRQNLIAYSVQFAKADVTDWQSQVDAYKKCIRNSPNKTVDIVIAAAGLNGCSIFHDNTFLHEGQTEDPAPPNLNVLEVNLTGAYYTACLAVHYFRQTAKSEDDFLKAEKQLVLIASNIAYYPVPLFSNYSASKAGVRALWVSLRSHPHLTGMRTNLLAPHIVRTPMTKDFQPMLDKHGIAMVELSEVVDVLIRFVCDDSIKGRAVAGNPGHAYDLCDEVEVGIFLQPLAPAIVKDAAMERADRLQTFQGAREFHKWHASETKDVFEWIGPGLEVGVQPGGRK